MNHDSFDFVAAVSFYHLDQDGVDSDEDVEHVNAISGGDQTPDAIVILLMI
jgi:hypothetical protein